MHISELFLSLCLTVLGAEGQILEHDSFKDRLHIDTLAPRWNGISMK